ncbi:hypothetical protein CRYO30217_02744 [Parvicella tangerina]|uniref:Uncharacterized protein n=1 Tax=Parvicella tangerina TaxID=2829795 RepID=A0A916JQW5_9FLAO|nr:hypothetical protein CRYO30217_02744 [Parvicella tangerina]
MQTEHVDAVRVSHYNPKNEKHEIHRGGFKRGVKG